MSTADVATPPTQPDFDPTSSSGSSSHAMWAGIIGGALSLAIGEVVAANNTSIISLVSAVGDVVVDITPGSLVAQSINTLGSMQKPLLLAGIAVVALIIAGAIGRRGLRDPIAVPVGFAVFGVVGALAAARSDLTNALGSWVVALIAAAVGAGVTLLLLRYARGPHAAVTQAELIIPGSPLSQAADRRRFIAFSGAAVGTAAVFAGSRLTGTSAAERARDEILAGSSTGTGSEVGATIPAPNWSPTTGEFDGIPGITEYITPISPRDEFYLIDTALTKPEVDPATWTLTIDGKVGQTLSLTYDDLMARDMVEREVTLSCVSNPVGGDLVGNAHWRGIPLTELLDEAGVDPTDVTTQIFMRSVDGFTCGFPTHLAYDGRTALLAVEMNGEPLPIIHGFPARIVVAGLYGYVSATKWIESISITDWEGVDGFWMPRGWSKEGPIKTQSRIDVPSHASSIPAGPIALGGIAWAPGTGIEKVEIAIGLEEIWQEVELATVDNDETWLQWKYDWVAEPGEWFIRVRATDKQGFTQSPVNVAPAPNGAEGFHTIQVRVT